MNDLEKYFLANTGNLIHKWLHYFEIYDRHFARFRGTSPHVLEFGVSHGGSLQMWRDYFGAGCKIYGVDINPRCAELQEEGIEIFIGDQGDVEFLRSLAHRIPRIDILIDDGSHVMDHQIKTLDMLLGAIDANGVYLCEDTHTSYWRGWGGGYRKKGSFIEYSKNFIDDINAWHSREPRKLAVSKRTRSIDSMHYYDSIVVIEKRPRETPVHRRIGQPRFPGRPQPRRNAVRRALDLYKAWRTK